MTDLLRKGAALASAVLLVGASPTGAATPSPKMARPGATRPAATATPSEELVFVPIAPCRAFDTSKSTRGAIAAGGFRTFFVDDAASFSSQGGRPSGCGVPVSAAAVALTLTTSASGGTGTLTATAVGQSGQTPTTAISFTANANASSGISLAVLSDRIKLTANGASTNVAGDITGYYAPQIQAFVDADGSIFSQTSRIVSSSHPSTGSYIIGIDRDVYYCSVVVTAAQGNFLTSAIGNADKTVTVNLFSVNGSGAPAAADGFFNLSVHC